MKATVDKFKIQLQANIAEQLMKNLEVLRQRQVKRKDKSFLDTEIVIKYLYSVECTPYVCNTSLTNMDTEEFYYFRSDTASQHLFILFHIYLEEQWYTLDLPTEYKGTCLYQLLNDLKTKKEEIPKDSEFKGKDTRFVNELFQPNNLFMGLTGKPGFILMVKYSDVIQANNTREFSNTEIYLITNHLIPSAGSKSYYLNKMSDVFQTSKDCITDNFNLVARAIISEEDALQNLASVGMLTSLPPPPYPQPKNNTGQDPPDPPESEIIQYKKKI